MTRKLPAGRRRAVAASHMALVASVLAGPGVAVAATEAGQPPSQPVSSTAKPVVLAAGDYFIFIKIPNDAIKLSGVYTVAGVGNGVTVYKLPDGRFFYLAKNGDMKFINLGDFHFKSK